MRGGESIFVDTNEYVWVDPPSGWQYGFPRLWNKHRYPDFRQWLTMHWYPDDGASWRNHCRMWPASAADVGNYDDIDNP